MHMFRGCEGFSSLRHTVDGRNPAPVDRQDFIFAGFYTSQVVQDVFYQQYQTFFRFFGTC